MRETIYTAESSLKHPAMLFAQMWRDLLASRELAWRLLVRDIKAQYRQSLFGVAWAFLPPVAVAVAFTLVSRAKIINVGATDLPYPLYVVFGTTLWQTFVESLNGPLQAVSAAKPMLARINFPREAIILAKLGEVVFNFAVKSILIVAAFVWFQVPVKATAVLAPGAVLILILLGTAFGLLLVPLGSLYQDVGRGVTLLVGFWFFLTPVIYPVPQGGTFEMIVKLNPVTHLLVTTRELTTTGAVSAPLPFAAVGAIAFIGLMLGWLVYHLAMPFVIERVSS